MNAENYLKGMKEEIIYNIVSENYLPPIVAEEVYNILVELLLELRPVRHLKKLSTVKLTAIDRQSEHRKLLIENWLTKALEHDETFIYTYNVLARRINASQGIVSFSIKKEDHFRLINFIEHEKNSEAAQGKENEERYRYDLRIMEKLFDHCNGQIMECESEEFFCAVETANFSAVKIKTKYQFRYLISLLGNTISPEWKTEAAKSIGCTQQQLTKDNSKSELSLWGRQLNRILK